MGDAEALVILAPHEHLAVVLHVLIAEHGVVRVQAVERCIHSLIGVSVLHEVVDELVSDDLCRCHRLAEEIGNLIVNVES